jgi:hypothetical protein
MVLTSTCGWLTPQAGCRRHEVVNLSAQESETLRCQRSNSATCNRQRCVANEATAQHATDIVVLPTLHSVPTDLRCSECLEYSRSGAAHAVAAQQPHCSGTARKLRCAASTVGVRRASPLFEEVVDARRERHDQLGCSTVRRTCGVHYRCSSEVFGAHGVMVCNTDTHCGAHFIAERCKYNCRTRARVSGSQCHSGPAVGHKATAI